MGRLYGPFRGRERFGCFGYAETIQVPQSNRCAIPLREFCQAGAQPFQFLDLLNSRQGRGRSIAGIDFRKLIERDRASLTTEE
jgi:hypothetical protein